MTDLPPTEDASAAALPIIDAGSANDDAPTAAQARAERRLQVRAALLLIATVALLVCSGLYLMWIRGAFEETQRLILLSDDAEGVQVGMDMTFAGFPIGRVRSFGLGEDARVRIVVDVPVKDIKWLRASSVFTLERGLVGGARLRAFTGMLEDKPLPPDAEREVLSGDVSAEIPAMVADARDVLGNIKRMTDENSELNNAVMQLRRFAQRVNGVKTGLIGALTGDDMDAKRASDLLSTSQQLIKRLSELTLHVDAAVSVSELNALLASTRQALEKADAILKDAQAIAGNAREASADLGSLRADVESSLQQVDGLITELNRKWPFAPKAQEIRLP